MSAADPLKFNPVEDLVLDDLPPKVWTGPHAGRRIADAFATLAAMPGEARTRSGLWPAYPYEFEDLLAQQEAGQRSPGRCRFVPSIEQITRMEAALCWPARYLAHRPELRAVNALARERSRGGNSLDVAQRLGGEPLRWQREHNTGCELIARGLIRDRVAVF